MQLAVRVHENSFEQTSLYFIFATVTIYAVMKGFVYGINLWNTSNSSSIHNFSTDGSEFPFLPSLIPNYIYAHVPLPPLGIFNGFYADAGWYASVLNILETCVRLL